MSLHCFFIAAWVPELGEAGEFLAAHGSKQ
jgi:hypothetical protein